ncbi:unnamed protein product [Brachionus calyciflorus]|uniref:LEM domain-containing protein n=1 Tax=Brachionus calyciflorus TaxID=104777 RepID=A0A813Q9S4_9BILA|nr:unnamed protein product [Brachionus calyciflorus]
MIRAEDIPSLDDDALMKVLKQAGLNKGPLTSTTRSLYEKKLIKFLKESKLPEENIAPKSNKNESVAQRPINYQEQEERIEKVKPQQPVPKPQMIIEPSVSRIEIQKINQVADHRQAQEPIIQTKKNEYIPIRPINPEPKTTSNFQTYQKADSVQVRQPQEPRQQTIIPPLNMQRERNLSRDSFEQKNTLESNKMKMNREIQSAKSANSTLPLEFKLINKEDDAKNKTISSKHMTEERPFIGYIKTDRQIQQQNYLLNRRSIVTLDKNRPITEQIRSNELNSKPLIDLSPRFHEKKIEESAQVSSSSVKMSKADPTQSDWLKNNLKYLLTVFLVAIIVFYFLQSTEEENPLME